MLIYFLISSISLLFLHSSLFCALGQHLCQYQYLLLIYYQSVSVTAYGQTTYIHLFNLTCICGYTYSSTQCNTHSLYIFTYGPAPTCKLFSLDTFSQEEKYRLELMKTNGLHTKDAVHTTFILQDFSLVSNVLKVIFISLIAKCICPHCHSPFAQV